MKIHVPKKQEVIRLTIKQENQETEYLNIIEATQEEVISFITKNFAKNTLKDKDRRTTIDVRHCIGGLNGKSVRINLYNINPKDFSKKFCKLIN